MRSKKVVEENFTPLPLQPNKKVQEYRCNHCPKTYARHVTRMIVHLRDECRSCPASTRRILKMSAKDKHLPTKKRKRNQSSTSDDDEENVAPSDSSSASQSVNNEIGIAGPSSGRNSSLAEQMIKRDSKVDRFMDQMGTKDKEHCQKLLARAIFASGTPLSIVENPHWLNLFKFLRPSFDVPTRHEISNPLLDEIYNEVRTKVEAQIGNASSVALLCDGWSNVRNEGIINVLITTPKPVFYASLATGTNSHTAQYMADEICKVIDSIGVEKVLGVCTDNAANMKRAWTIIEEHYENKKIVFYGCAAHILHLLVKDLLAQPSVNKVVKDATAIAKKIKTGHVILAVFREIQFQDREKVAISLKLPGATRWGSTVMCFESLLVNKYNLQALAISPKVQKNIDQLTKSRLLDEDFWILLNKINSLLKPIVQWITNLQADQSTIARVAEAFAEIRQTFVSILEESPISPVPAAEKVKIFEALDKRTTMAVQPVHCAANLLDPSLKGMPLDADQTSKAFALIYELANRFSVDLDQLSKELAEYSISEGHFGQEYVRRSITAVSASKWWQAMCKNTALSEIAIAILNLPATSGAAERSFSTQGWIHSAKRNRLTTKRAGDLTYIAHNFKLFQEANDEKKPEQRTALSIPVSQDDDSSSEIEDPFEEEQAQESDIDEDAPL